MNLLLKIDRNCRNNWEFDCKKKVRKIYILCNYFVINLLLKQGYNKQVVLKYPCFVNHNTLQYILAYMLEKSNYVQKHKY
jgi:hypothetical protein